MFKNLKVKNISRSDMNSKLVYTNYIRDFAKYETTFFNVVFLIVEIDW